MTYEFKHQRKVEFPDTDMAGIMHFSNYMRFMEAAELEMYESLGVSPLSTDKDGMTFGIPRVHASCDFISPLKFADVVETQVLVERLGTKSITYKFILRKKSANTNPIVAVGKIIVVAVNAKKLDGPLKAIAIPEEFKNKLTEAPKELLKPKEIS